MNIMPSKLIIPKAPQIMTRRRALKVLTAGTGLTLTAASPLFSRIARASCSMPTGGSSSTAPKNLIVIFANGGLRTTDCWDYYSSGDIDNSTNNSGCEKSSNDWVIPSWASPLYSGTDWTQKMTVVRNVNFGTASHPTGKIYALNGRNATTKPAGPVIVGNDTDWDALVGGTPNLKSWNMGYPLTAGGKEPSIPGEPSDLADLFNNVGYAGGAAGDLPDLSIASALTADNGRFSLIPSIASRFFEWWDPTDTNGVDETAGDLLDANISETFDGTDFSGYLDSFSTALGNSGTQNDNERFAGAVSAIKSGVSRVVTIAMQTSFDTHTTNQQSLISDLSTYIATTMDLLGTDLDETLILVTSDFDRTPQYNSRSGTDHQPVGAVALFGAGLNYGAFGPKRDTLEAVHYTDLSDLANISEDGSSGETITREHLWATVLDLFGIDSTLHFNTGKPIGAIQG
jgi:hypothetical protein